ncbi:MAG TPA: biotin--[acetyl-CoA-carboxylase] ligase [Clostridia bacterium]|nr:biotin--[acetyl-CoA-carboxylase] ligase [Clostridia bacterium]
MMRRERVDALLKTSAIGRSAVFLENVDSTNLEAKRMAQVGCTHGQLVVSEHQREGRGRRGKAWSDKAGQSICMSLVLRPAISAELAPRYPLAAALALYETLDSMGISAKIKWPNDLLHRGKKLSGILLEAGMSEAGLFLVAGIGVNVNQASFDGDIRDTATSLRLIAGKELEREAVLAIMLNFMEGILPLCETDEGFERLLNRYAAASCTFGQKVDIIGVDKKLTGIAETLDAFGRLMVRTLDGALVAVNAGDVSLRDTNEN